MHFRGFFSRPWFIRRLVPNLLSALRFDRGWLYCRKWWWAVLWEVLLTVLWFGRLLTILPLWSRGGIRRKADGILGVFACKCLRWWWGFPRWVGTLTFPLKLSCTFPRSELWFILSHLLWSLAGIVGSCSSCCQKYPCRGAPWYPCLWQPDYGTSATLLLKSFAHSRSYQWGL